jgi:hypothetical protein
MSSAHQCPVCQARFRGSRLWSRCGADLGPLMMLAVQAWRLRQEARDALARGDLTRARQLADTAQAVHRTSRGASLRLLAKWLDDTPFESRLR